MKIIEDKYQGVTIDNSDLPRTTAAFSQALTTLITQLSDKKLLWIKLSTHDAKIYPSFNGNGFSISSLH